jgi:hypothetical protein
MIWLSAGRNCGWMMDVWIWFRRRRSCFDEEGDLDWEQIGWLVLCWLLFGWKVGQLSKTKRKEVKE